MTNKEGSVQPAYTAMVNLASQRLGTEVVFANDDFFAEKENLVKDAAAIFIADKYTDRGKWMDGWESRRRRVPGNDFCIIKLGLSGRIHGFDVDTSHFLGNHPPYAKISALVTDESMSVDALKDAEWTEILPKSPLQPGSHNYFPCTSQDRWTHLRMDIFPDGGVARLRVHGHVTPHWPALVGKKGVDLVSVKNGGEVIACNDMFFGPKDNLIMPGRGVNMGDGWETKRKREPGHDWVVLKLGRPGYIHEILVDTAHFKGNFPDRCSIEACYNPGLTAQNVADQTEWISVLGETKLQADHEHHFRDLSGTDRKISHVRMNIFPDGGVSRLRLFGSFA